MGAEYDPDTIAELSDGAMNSHINVSAVRLGQDWLGVVLDQGQVAY
jgi:hypothetical protein